MEERNAELSQQFCCCRMACLLDWCEASKIRRERLKAIESVSLMDIDLAVLGKPKERECLSNLRAWMTLRLSEYDCLPMRSFQVSEPTCMSRANRTEPSGKVSAVDREKPRGCSSSVNGQADRESCAGRALGHNV